MLTEDHPKSIEAPKKKKVNSRSKLKLHGALFGARIKDIFLGEGPLTMPHKEPEKKVAMFDTSDVDKILETLEKSRENQTSTHQREGLELSHLLEMRKEYPNFENNMQLQSDADSFKYNSSTLLYLEQLREVQKTPLEPFSLKRIGYLKEKISESLEKENNNLVKYAKFLSGKHILLIYKFMLQNHETFLFNPMFGYLVKICKKRLKELKELELHSQLHQH